MSAMAARLLSRFQGGTLKALLLRGFAWTTLGFAGSQVLRLASNLALTRLLAPEHFGLMAIVTVLLIGLAMFSDIGLGPSVVRSQKTKDERFLNTAWTMQIVRGAVLVMICALLGVPAAHFYNEPQLAWLLPVAGLPLLITSFAPIQVYTLQREVALGRLIGIDFIAQIAAIIAMVGAALVYRSVWILVLGAVVASLVKTVAQWRILPVHRHRLDWAPEDVHELVRFGSWIFLSTLLSFGANSAGSLVLGKLASMEKVGLFTIAATLAKASEQFYEQISQRVLFPIYATLNTEGNAAAKPRITKIRAVLVALFVPPMCLAACFGPQIFHLLFDARYQGGAWMFQAILLGLVPSVITSTLPYFLSQGNSRLNTGVSAVKFVGYIAVIAIGYHLGGDNGAIVGMAALPVLLYLLEYGLARRHGLSDFRVDACALAVWGATLAWLWP